ncbi:hypothetical protein MiSe_31440 [Microseira wollei NIES-4236]|uniref:Transposase n=1 Tax=Microseira wollei NIES-4236 TaxID=2530354 RepID=A0AAV3XAL1_9CYAN|nr:hypothetical protein MiSe_31440 [Microseira wollei NIES-4236]
MDFQLLIYLKAAFGGYHHSTNGRLGEPGRQILNCQGYVHSFAFKALTHARPKTVMRQSRDCKPTIFRIAKVFLRKS